MIILFFTIFSYCAQALMMPPGFVIRQYGHTRDKVSTAKIEQKVSYDDISFNESILYKSKNKYKIEVSNNNASILFVRNGDKCLAMVGQKKVDIQCLPARQVFYYSILLSNSDPFINYLKSLDIDPRETVVTAKKEDSIDFTSYSKPDGIELLNHNNHPIYVIGVSEGAYRGAVDAASGKPDMSTALIDELKYRTPQIWMDKNSFYPYRVFGKHNSDDFELILSSYIMDGNDVPFPKVITLSLKGKNMLTYNVSTFETAVDLSDEALSFETFKKLTPAKKEDFGDIRGKMLDYLKEYR